MSIQCDFLLLLQVTEVENDMTNPVQEDEGPSAVSQLARKVRKHWQVLKLTLEDAVYDIMHPTVAVLCKWGVS